ncbi:bacteriohemerythrin [Rhodocyclus tenuis]|nr:bacteriohemerythrin [Rhodocyclus tenuis]MBK1681882.1 hypothetical protein [Rhodocyclus tenuis]
MASQLAEQLRGSPLLANTTLHLASDIDEAHDTLNAGTPIAVTLLHASDEHPAPAHVESVQAVQPQMAVLVRCASALPAVLADALWDSGVADRLFTQDIADWAATLSAALREHDRRRLHLLVNESPARLAGGRSFGEVAALALHLLDEHQLASRGALFCIERHDPAAQLIAVAGKGSFAGVNCTPLAAIEDAAARDIAGAAWTGRRSLFGAGHAALFIETSAERTQPALIVLQLDAALPSWRQRILESFTRAVAPAVEHSQLTQQLVRTQRAMISTLAMLAEYRDTETARHVTRVARLSAEIAGLMAREDFGRKLAPQLLEHIGHASVLHDLGKIAVSENVLLKPGPLDAGERQQVKRHVIIGHDILKQSVLLATHGEAQLFELAAEIARSHHEHYDGSGYPDGLASEEIPLAARIVAVVDVFDALISKRPYKYPWSDADALRLIREKAGTHFDPAVVDAFCAVHERKAKTRFIEWSDAMSVGNPELDNDHRRLIEIVNQLGVNVELRNHNSIEFILDDLTSFVHEHFRREEAYLEQIGFPDRQRHRDIHTTIMARIDNARWKYLQGFLTAIEDELLSFLTQWLNQHICGEGRQYAAYAGFVEASSSIN